MFLFMVNEFKRNMLFCQEKSASTSRNMLDRIFDNYASFHPAILYIFSTHQLCMNS